MTDTNNSTSISDLMDRLNQLYTQEWETDQRLMQIRRERRRIQSELLRTCQHKWVKDRTVIGEESCYTCSICKQDR